MHHIIKIYLIYFIIIVRDLFSIKLGFLYS